MECHLFLGISNVTLFAPPILSYNLILTADLRGRPTDNKLYYTLFGTNVAIASYYSEQIRIYTTSWVQSLIEVALARTA